MSFLLLFIIVIQAAIIAGLVKYQPQMTEIVAEYTGLPPPPTTARLGIKVRELTPIVEKINGVLDHTQTYGCSIVGVLRKHMKQAIKKAKKAKVTSVPCSLLKEKSMTLGGQVLSIQDRWGTKESEKQFELFLRKGLDYNKKASKAHAKEFAAAVGNAPEAASKIQVLLFDILNMLAAENCVDGALDIDEVEKIANDVFDVLCSVNTDNTSTPAPAPAPEPFTM